MITRHRSPLALLVGILLLVGNCDGSSSPSSGMVLRIRLADGSMQKVMVPQGAEETMTLSDILNTFEIADGSSIQVGKENVDDNGKQSPLSGLGVTHGSLITVVKSKAASAKTADKPTESRFSQLKVPHREWDPFPDLAKNYEHALLKTKTRRSGNHRMSYGDISRLQSSLHIVEPQPEGSLKRVYMCRNSAERFQVNGIPKQKTKTGATVPLSRVGLLLGTIQTERVDKTPRKARTSLSSQTSDSEFCIVAKVQALWEPPGQKSTAVYDAALGENLLHDHPRVLAIAEHLGLVPVGWIFTHPDSRHQEEDALPVYGVDVQTGATLQIANMKKARDVPALEGKNFVTLAMDANNGATEAFQLSDVSVQMVHEGILVPKRGEPSQRHVPTKHGVLVDGKETTQLDSVLCLVNTAMLSHVGSYAGKTAASSVKKNGSLTNKCKKALLKALLEDDSNLLEELCDLNTLVALDQSLSKEDTEELCGVVRKWARGQKQGTQLGSKLKMHLRSLLET
jgi:hypothetical protein